MIALSNSSKVASLLSPVFDDKLIQSQVLDLNTEEQLYEKGVDADGDSLGYYSPFTIRYKKTLAGVLGNDTRVDHITLKDTGAFYRSFRFRNKKTGFSITANPVKDAGTNLLERWPQAIGLTDESKKEVGRMAIEPFAENIKAHLLK